jgi:hypothetical protein
MMDNSFIHIDWVLGAVAGVVVMLVAMLAVYVLLDFGEKQSKTKEQNKARRDALIEDLMNRVWFEQAKLSEDALRARKILIRVSFDVGSGQGKENEQNKPDNEPPAAQPPGKQQQK